jgi:hypothetical protein
MFGAKKIPSIPNWLKIIEDFKSSKQNQEKLDDQIFLANDIYPLIKDDLLIHANFHKYEGEICLNFPILSMSQSNSFRLFQFPSY